MKVIKLEEIKSHFESILDEVQAGEEYCIEKEGVIIAKIAPFCRSDKPRKPGGSWEGKVWMADDFDETPPEFLTAFYGEK